MKKILTVLLLWTALCGTAFPQNASDFTVDVNGVITKYTGFDTDIKIPDTISGKKITAIGKEAFQKADLTSVTIPNSVTEIGENAFAQNQLTSVTMGTGVKTIGKSAFANNKLTSITIPNGDIGESAFAQNQLASVTIGNGVTSIGKSAFANNKLTSVTVPCSVGERAFFGNPLATIVLSERARRIEKEAFANTKCTSVSLPSTLEEIDASAFDTSGKPSFMLAANINANFSFFLMFYSYIANDRKAGTFAFDAQSVRKNADGYEYYENQYGAVLTKYTGDSTRVRIPTEIGSVNVKALYGTFQKSPLVAVQIPESVTYIGGSSFLENKQLVGVTIPNSVTYIGDNAFKGCASLDSVTIGNGVTYIGEDAFADCQKLAAITVDVGNTAYSSVDGIVYNKNKTVLMLCPVGKAGAFTIPNGVTNIRESAFEDCARLTGITIPNSVTGIGFMAFYNCTSLTSVTFQGTITSGGFFSSRREGNRRFLGTFPTGDLYEKFYATDKAKGTPGTYTRPNGESETWTKR